MKASIPSPMKGTTIRRFHGESMERLSFEVPSALAQALKARAATYSIGYGQLFTALLYEDQKAWLQRQADALIEQIEAEENPEDRAVDHAFIQRCQAELFENAAEQCELERVAVS